MAEADPADRLAYAYQVLLPIWERWTVGNPALRRFLDCQGADPASHEERLLALVRTSGELRRRGRMGKGVGAAGLAASACMKGYVGVPEAVWQRAIEQAVAEGIAATLDAEHPEGASD